MSRYSLDSYQYQEELSTLQTRTNHQNLQKNHKWGLHGRKDRKNRKRVEIDCQEVDKYPQIFGGTVRSLSGCSDQGSLQTVEWVEYRNAALEYRFIQRSFAIV